MMITNVHGTHHHNTNGTAGNGTANTNGHAGSGVNNGTAGNGVASTTQGSSSGRSSSGHSNDHGLALILIGIVLVFLACHSLRFFLAFYKVKCYKGIYIFNQLHITCPTKRVKYVMARRTKHLPFLWAPFRSE